jgi:3-deoxy-D-manno-octulosonic-acid transferase
VKLRKPVHVLVTSNTRQGMDIIAGTITDMASEKENIRISSAYFPFDCPGIMKQAVKEVSPDVMVLLESDLWPGLLSALKRAGSKVLVINGRMAEKSLRHYQIWPSFWKHLAPDRIFAVSHEDALRFGALFGKDRVSIMSNIKFDRISATEIYPEIVESIERILPSDIPFLVLASVRKEEEPLILKMIQKILTDHPKTVIGLFPRHMHRLSHWQKALSKISIPWRYRSETMEPVEPGTVLVWDSFGELASSYQLAKAAFVGGSLAPLGGQNFLEPLLHGVIPVIGPSWFNFYWVGRQIIDLKLVHIADDWEKAANLLIHALKIPFSRENIRNAAIAYIKQHQGGTAGSIAKLLLNIFRPYLQIRQNFSISPGNQHRISARPVILTHCCHSEEACTNVCHLALNFRQTKNLSLLPAKFSFAAFQGTKNYSRIIGCFYRNAFDIFHPCFRKHFTNLGFRI